MVLNFRENINMFLLGGVGCGRKDIGQARAQSYGGTMGQFGLSPLSTWENPVAASQRNAAGLRLATPVSRLASKVQLGHKAYVTKQNKNAHLTLIKNSSCIMRQKQTESKIVQNPSFHPSANFSACSQFGDKTPSGLTFQSDIPASQTKHTDCQSKQTSLLTTKSCLHNSLL